MAPGRKDKEGKEGDDEKSKRTAMKTETMSAKTRATMAATRATSLQETR